MTDDNRELRIGDAERDEALTLLQDHLAAGRLDHEEFDDRVARALTARTGGQLAELFVDLPGPRPGGAGPSALVPAPGPAPVPDDDPPHETPWYAQWWLILVAIGIAGLTRGRLGVLVPAMAAWLWIVYPSLVRSRRPRTPHPVVEPTAAQWAEITSLLRTGQKIAAIKAYREATGAGLAYAKDAVEARARELDR